MIRAILSGMLLALACSGQSFEVASIKPAPPPNGQRMFMGMSGGPGSPTPGLFSCQNCSLPMLVTQAYDIKSYQLSGANGLDGERFNISAKVPAGTTKEDFRLMQQNLLAERFKLKIHREKKEMQMYELVVGKNGSKLKESVVDVAQDGAPAPPPAFPSGPPKLDRDGFPDLPPGARGPIMLMMNGRARMKATHETMENFAGMLSRQMGKPVVDGTRLKGRYDFTLGWAPDGMMMGPMGRGGPMPPQLEGGGLPVPLSGAPEGESGPTLIGALQEQLGLRLEQKKGPVDIVVIDHVEKVPTEN